MSKKVEIIAEVKTKSPFGFQSEKSWDELFAIANEVGDIISIHTDVRWDGSFNLVKKAKSLTGKPILAKGFHKSDSEIRKAIDAGADYVLSVGRIPEIYKEKCFIEPLSLAELEKIPENLKVVWNTRDLDSGDLKKETFEEARSIFKGWLCQASNIKTILGTKVGANAILVGSHLPEFHRSMSSRD